MEQVKERNHLPTMCRESITTVASPGALATGLGQEVLLGQSFTGSLQDQREFTREILQGRALQAEKAAGATAQLRDWVLGVLLDSR